jgi:hypothetical protein
VYVRILFVSNNVLAGCVEVLLESGADVTARNKKHKTAADLSTDQVSFVTRIVRNADETLCLEMQRATRSEMARVASNCRGTFTTATTVCIKERKTKK